MRILIVFLLLLMPVAADQIELVESYPIETDFDQPDIRQAQEVWLEQIGRAQKEILWQTFYLAHEKGRATEPVIKALKKAAKRGVKVYLLVDEIFYNTYPETLDELAAIENIELRKSPFGRWMDGVMHAKAMFVDGRWGFIGSQNLDWRSLEHIRELGVLFDSPDLVACYSKVFWWEWEHTNDRKIPTELPAVDSPMVGFGEAMIFPTFSPNKLTPKTATTDEKEIRHLLGKAKTSAKIALLSYSPVTRDGRHFYPAIDNSIRAAAVRGVKVQLLLAHWVEKKDTLDHLLSLDKLKNVEIRACRIPEAKEGPIPFARVHHSKYLVVDGRRAWLGTANWGRGYFRQSRNYGLVMRGGEIPPRLDKLFDFDWERSTALKPAKH